MAQKPEIQYIGQFYVYGSEAKKLAAEEQKKRARTRLPLTRLRNIRKIYVDPVAICGMAVAVLMLVTMALGGIQVWEAWDDYTIMSEHLSETRRENARLERTYRNGYNLEEIEAAALTMGMVPVSELPTLDVTVTVPAPEKEMTQWDEFLWFLDGLLE